MKVMTTVRGRVPASQREEFEGRYAALKGAPLPEGLERSNLLRSSKDQEEYTIQTFWSSMDALQAMRSAGKPAAVALFEGIGVSPTVEIHEVAGTLP